LYVAEPQTRQASVWRWSSSLRLRGFSHFVSPSSPSASRRHPQTEAFFVFRIVQSNVSPVQSKSKLETLDSILAQA
jgi:hypothetical protein